MSKQNPDAFDWRTVLLVVLALFIVVNIVSYAWFPFLPWFEQREAGEQIVEDQMDAEKALQDYRWFRQQYHDIQAQRAQVQNAYEEEEQFHETYGNDPNEWSRQAEERHGRIHERITGNKNMLEQMVADYNARSDDATRAVFKCHLPYQVDERFAIQGPPGEDAPDQPQDVDVNGSTVEPGTEVPPPEECDGLPEEVRSNAQSSNSLAAPTDFAVGITIASPITDLTTHAEA